MPSRQQRFTGICFDLDGVLIDSMPMHADAWIAAGQELGLRVSRRFIYEHEGEPGSKTAKLLQADPRNKPFDFKVLLAKKEAYFRKHARHIKPFRVLSSCLPQLKKRGLKLALVTGTSSQEVRRAVAAKVLRNFDAIITGDQVKRGKPNPEPYLTAFAKLGLQGSRVIVVENAPYGITAARRAKAGHIVAFASSLPKRYLAGAGWIGTTQRSVARHLKAATSVVDAKYAI